MRGLANLHTYTTAHLSRVSGDLIPRKYMIHISIYFNDALILLQSLASKEKDSSVAGLNNAVMQLRKVRKTSIAPSLFC